MLNNNFIPSLHILSNYDLNYCESKTILANKLAMMLKMIIQGQVMFTV